ncbi:MAG: diguanylate cyclase [Deltaproteobacteria bacterium]|nr:diguanylate cyclase [Deltaproteobacteria bacterium]
MRRLFRKYISRLRVTNPDVPLYILIVLIVLILAVSVMLYFAFKQTRQAFHERQVAEFRGEFNVGIEGYALIADSFFNTMVDRDDVKALFAMGITAKSAAEKNKYRTRLYNYLEDGYRHIQQYDFTQLHFHEKDNRSYLRFHRPKTFGDDLTGVRQSVMTVNQTHRYVRGFEAGRTFSGFRYVYPLEYRGEHLGSVEIGISMKSILNLMKRMFGRDTLFVVSRSLLDNREGKSATSGHIPWKGDSDYMLDRSVNAKSMFQSRLGDDGAKKIREALKRHLNTVNGFAIDLAGEGIYASLVAIPIQNFKKQTVAFVIAEEAAPDANAYHLSFTSIATVLWILIFTLVVFTFYYRYSQRKIAQLAERDGLTTVYNRAAFMRRLQEEFSRFQRYKKPFTLIILDIDHFKKVNDRFGHLVGDRVLKQFCLIVLNQIREIDVVGRYGGEEFFVLLPDSTLEAGHMVANRIRSKVASANWPEVKTVTVSAGFAQVNAQHATIEQLIESADRLLYIAKESGRNQVRGPDLN